MLQKLTSSATVWLGGFITIIGTALDFLHDIEITFGGLPGVHQQFVEAGLDEQTIAKAFSIVGPLIVLARLRSLRSQP